MSLFLDGDVSFLPDNSFPSHLQLLKVGISLQYNDLPVKYGLELFFFAVLHLVISSFSFILSAAGGLVETVPVGLSAHGMCVRVTSQRESQKNNSVESSVVRRRCDLGFVRWFQVEVPQIDRLLSQLEEMSCTCSHQLSYSSAAKCFAGLVNKRPQG